MMELHIPHQDPIKFAKYILFRDEKEALVQLSFDTSPSLAMLIEAAAQASGAFATEGTTMGFVVSLKGCKLLQKPQTKELRAKLIKEYEMGNMHSFAFSILEDNAEVAQGSFVLVLE